MRERECEGCEGTGYTQTVRDWDKNPNKKKTSPCGLCHGSGWVYEDDEEEDNDTENT